MIWQRPLAGHVHAYMHACTAAARDVNVPSVPCLNSTPLPDLCSTPCANRFVLHLIGSGSLLSLNIPAELDRYVEVGKKERRQEET